jgi:PAS domain S-box-containing protein
MAKTSKQLRKEAEKSLAASGEVPPAADATLKLLHELRVHQIELESQNHELRQAQQALEEARNNYQDLFEFAPVGYLSLSKKGLIEEANQRAAAALGRTCSQLINQPFSNFVHADDVAAWQRLFSETLAGAVSQSCELTLVGKDSHCTPVHLVGQRREPSSCMKVRIAFSDITHIRSVEASMRAVMDELVRSNEELTRFAHIAAHDLQEPINTVIRYVQWIDKHLGGRLEPSEKEVLEFIIGATHRLHELVTGLLSYSRVDAQVEPYAMVQLETVVAEVLKNLESSIKDSGAKVTVGALPSVLADRQQMVALFQNLISNAIKYRTLAGQPTIAISVEKTPGSYIFSIADNGIGIDPAYKDMIFIIFKRLHTSQAYPGTGIGLALCKRIVERHHGNIWVESAPNGGSVFKFTLPIAVPEAMVQEE